MKAFFSKILAISCIAIFAVSSCKKDETLVQAQDGKPTTLTASSNSLVLTKANAEQPAVTFTLSKPDFGYSAAVTNTLQLAVKGTDFATPKEVTLDAGSLDLSYNVIDFNALLLAMNLPTSVNTTLEARVKSQITSSTLDPVYSNVIELNVNPYPLISFVYVPGDYQGWTPATADSLMSPTSNGIYEGVIQFPDNPGATFEFKVTDAKTGTITWYGDAGNGAFSSTGGNFKVPGAGSYQLHFDFNNNTYEIAPLQWSIIGDAPEGSNWANDVDMKYDNGKRVWVATVNMEGGKQYKFRKNHDWGTNFGSTLDADGAQTASTGELKAGGKNFGISETGKYKVTLNLVANTYSIEKVN